ncbi:MAG: hypothetical protein AAF825_02930 [Pseudomonadota bacterium]
MPDEKSSSKVTPLRPVEAPNADADRAETDRAAARKAAAQNALARRAEDRARAREEARAAARARAAELKAQAAAAASEAAEGPADLAEDRAVQLPATTGGRSLAKRKGKPATKKARRKAKLKARAAARAERAEIPPAELELAALPPASLSQPKPRHRMVLVGFVAMVVLPLMVAGWYLWNRAADQYVSELGFTVRKEETAVPSDLFGGLTGLSSGGSSDTDVLFEYIQSQELVQLVDESLDLRSRFSVHHETDPFFSFDPEGSIEDLVAFWRRMVQVSYDPGSGMLDLRAFAFEAEEAQEIAEEILKHSSRVINDLSAIAREDATRYAREDLMQAQDELKDARGALTGFRSRTRIIDPSADLQGQMGLLTTLQQQLAEAMIELDLLRDTTVEGDPRISRALRRIDVIETRIEEERSKFGQGGVIGTGLSDEEQDYATLVAEFERLTVDREFAEQTYIAALSAFAAAKAEAERQSLYLAPYVRPTLAETARHPQRLLLIGLTGLFLILAWSIVVLVYYSLRDRQ